MGLLHDSVTAEDMDVLRIHILSQQTLYREILFLRNEISLLSLHIMNNNM